MPTLRLRKGLGRKSDAPDARDLHVPQIAHLGIGAPLPSNADVFVSLSLPIYDQGELGSCTANAGVLYRRFLAQRFNKYSAPDEDLSRLFLYYQERKLPWNNDVAEDGGAAIRDLFYVLAHTGVCPEVDDPYVQQDFDSSPMNDSSEDLAQAARFRLGAYHRIPSVEIAKSVLASGYAVALGFTVYESFEDIGAEGIMPMPKPGEQAIGGHAVVIRGYDDQKSGFLIQNSWGPGWGDRGCFWMPYAFLENAALSQFDMWMGHLGKPWRLN
ncbi:MAG: C1 family peptidase [Candidatus Acidiferrales bacterium]